MGRWLPIPVGHKVGSGHLPSLRTPIRIPSIPDNSCRQPLQPVSCLPSIKLPGMRIMYVVSGIIFRERNDSHGLNSLSGSNSTSFFIKMNFSLGIIAPEVLCFTFK